MKTKLTVTIDEGLVSTAKQKARAEGVSLSQLIERALAGLTTDPEPSFFERWRGRFRAAGRQDERYRKLARKYL